MSRRKVVNLAHSVHQRLLQQAKASDKPFNELLQNYAMERFLYRLGRSPHRDRFVLKGALMLRAWASPLSRPTLDIDLSAKQSMDGVALAAMVRDCIGVSVEDDGLGFDPATVHADAIRHEAVYDGWRIRFSGHLGNARIHMQVDVGFGDVVVPAPVAVEFPTLLGMPAPRLKGITRESAIAEKFEAMAVLDMANSRMKDFYDIWSLAKGFDFEGAVLARAIEATFKRRQTPIPTEEPVALTKRFAEDKTKERQWAGFLKRGRLGGDHAPSLPVIVEFIRGFLMPPTATLASNRTFAKRWAPGGPWQP